MKGLSHCWLPQYDRWSHIYHLDGRTDPNESLEYSDIYYSLNVLLGLSRTPKIPETINCHEIYSINAARLLRSPAPLYAYGMAIWCAAELNLDLPIDISRRLRSILADRDTWMTFRAQDLGLILIGVVAQARRSRGEWPSKAGELFDHLRRFYLNDSKLFSDASNGPRRRFGTFSTQTYLTLACYVYAEFSGDPEALKLAKEASAKIISLQGPNGEWPWLFDVSSGTIADYYEVYTVHQYGMAPAFLEHAERQNVHGAREALINGFHWVLGKNQLKKSMLVPELCLSFRSQLRKGELHNRAVRLIRVLLARILGKRPSLLEANKIDIRRECRSYELGWILWSFGARDDLPEITEHVAFSN